MSAFTFTMSEEQARAIHKLVASHNSALKNWTATAVENGDLARAQELVKELRAHQALFAAFNMDAKHEIALHRGLPVERNIAVQDR